MSPVSRCPVSVMLAALSLGDIASAAAQSAPVVVAILPFEDRGSYGQKKEVFQALELGIPATIAGELGSHAELRLAQSSRVARLLESRNLGPGSHLDAATAARIGKEAGARYAITGSFADFYGKFRLEARIVDTETGQIVNVVTNRDAPLQDRRDLYRIVQLVGHKVLAEASTTAPGQPAETDRPVVPTEALTDYSLGLLYEYQGDSGKAAQHYRRALSAYPDYSEAREAVRRVGP